MKSRPRQLGEVVGQVVARVTQPPGLVPGHLLHHPPVDVATSAENRNNDRQRGVVNIQLAIGHLETVDDVSVKLPSQEAQWELSFSFHRHIYLLQ